MANQTAEQEINYALANNLTNDKIWYTAIYSDMVLIKLLILLIGKSTNTIEKFGIGNGDVPGYTDNKGLFYGDYNHFSSRRDLKVFGISNLWSGAWIRTAGYIMDNGIQKVKMTYGQNDGSTIDGYNLDGNGYIVIPSSTPIGNNGSYINKMLFTIYGLMPKSSTGSSSTYYTDRIWRSNTGVCYAMFGDMWQSSDSGLFATDLNSSVSRTANYISTLLSCKPLAKSGGEI